MTKSWFKRSALAALWLLLWSSGAVSISGCVTVSTFEQFANAVANAGSSLSLCPFDIAKPSASNLRLANKSVRITCEKTKESDKCRVRGTGNIIRIQGSETEVMMEGFTFQGASEAALRIAPTSTKTHTFYNCEFLQNQGSMNKWRGGAIKTEPGTSLVVSSCKFFDNVAGQGGAIFHRGDFLKVMDCSFTNNVANQGGAIQGDEGAFFEVHDTVFTDNRALISLGGAIAVEDRSILTSVVNVRGTGNRPCNGIHDESDSSCDLFDDEIERDNDQPFVPGELSVMKEGLKLSTGLKVTLLAKSGERIRFTSPQSKKSQSSIPFHKEPDGAAVFEVKDGGWVYLSNSEVRNGGGGVFGLEFDSSGRPRDYVARLKGTSRNCAGGKTPWNTWVSCEEFGKGQCWQVDPTGRLTPDKTELVEPAGGNFESMAVDFRRPNNAKFFVTEDHKHGAIRRFRPCSGAPASWDMLHREGTIDYLEFVSDTKFRWTKSLAAGRSSAFKYYPNVEGISHDMGILSFVSKVEKQIYRLDLDKFTYTVSSTYLKHLEGGGSFGGGPDQLIQHGDMLYFTEDGGRSPGVFVYDGTRYYALFEAYAERYFGDETTGLAFSPDGTKLYVCFQEIGYLFQFEREDGLPFEGGRRLLGMKYHLDKTIVGG